MDNKVKMVFPAAGEKRTIVWPCTIDVPQEGGTTQPQLVDVRFNLISREEREKAFDNAVKEGKRGDLAVYDLVVAGFPTFMDANGALVGDAVAIPFFRAEDYRVTGIVRGFGEMNWGRPAKN